MKLTKSLNAWGSLEFTEILKFELEEQPIDALPLQEGLLRTSNVMNEPFNVMVLNSSTSNDSIRAKVGVWYKGVIGGCSCADDPSPVDSIDEYCEVEIEIDKATGCATAVLAKS